MVTLFAYGTLMRGGVRHPVLADQRFLGEARTRPYYALFDLGAYPGLVRSAGEGRVIHGELYEIDAGLIGRLDRIEGAPSLFRLEPILIDGHAGEVVAYFYQGNVEGFPPCADGRWKNQGSPHDT
jgi:gamma-glutamylaminecyclotransferase